MKKYVVMILIAIVLIIGGGTFAYFHFCQWRTMAGDMVGRAGRRCELVRRSHTKS